METAASWTAGKVIPQYSRLRLPAVAAARLVQPEGAHRPRPSAARWLLAKVSGLGLHSPVAARGLVQAPAGAMAYWRRGFRWRGAAASAGGRPGVSGEPPMGRRR